MSSSFKKALLLLAFIFIVSQLVLAGYLLWGAVSKKEVQQPVPVPPSDFEVSNELINNVNKAVQDQLARLPQSLSEELRSSRLYFMLTRKGLDHNDQLTQSYVFENGAFSVPEEKENDAGDLYYSFSPNGAYGVLSELPAALRDARGEQAKIRTFAATSLMSAFPAMSATMLADSSTLARKQHPSISNTGEVLFVAWDGEGVPTVQKAEEWSIYKISGGKSEFLTKGFMPKWISDDSFVYLKNDGLYLSSIDLSEDTKIASSKGELYSNSRIDVSADGTAIAWMQPDVTQVSVFELQDAGFVEKAPISLKGYWVAFSPSGNYLALQTINKTANGTEANPNAKIEFYDLTTMAKVPQLEINLDAFEQQSMFMTEWVKK
jgi:hypothetical protein